MSELNLHAAGQEETRSSGKLGRKAKFQVGVALTKSALSHSFGGFSEHGLRLQSERHSISVVTPVYNGEASIAELCQRLSEVLPRIATEYEIILVNDGSRDRSWEMISELSFAFATVRGLNLMRNYGQHNALLCGIRAAKYE